MSTADINEFLRQDAEKDILRFSTAGSVDDGKSTLIGRLLHDSKEIYEDQLAAVKKASGRINAGVEIDFSLLTDGLKAEREQGITIDVAYRYFSTPKRKFIIADTPGHEQYTRNMATGASTADLAVILIDARNGVLTQSKRHSFISSLLRIPHMIVAVNKMDLVDYSEDVFEAIKKDFSNFAAKLSIGDLHFIPLSALCGDNVVERSAKMPWYKGPALLEYLENVYIASDRNLIDLRFPVQTVLRPNLNFRGYAGQIASGVVKKGDELLAVPSMRKSRVKSIVTYEGELDYAFAPQSVAITLEDELDVSRGEMLVHVHNIPRVNRHFEAMIVWMSESPLDPSQQYIIKQTSRQTQIRIDEIRYRTNVNTMHREQADNLQMNEIGRIVCTARQPLFFDPYTKNRATGSFIVIDMLSNNTVAAGMILDREPSERLPSKLTSKDSTNRRSPSLISAEEREKRLSQRPVTVWLTGLPACGKKDIAYALEKQLFDLGKTCVLLDGGSIRAGLSRELDFSSADRAENIRRAAETARLLNEHGLIAICAFVSADGDVRAQAAEIIGADRFLDIHVDAAIEYCASNDKSGLYEKWKNGELRELAGVSHPYEAPEKPALRLDIPNLSTEAATTAVLKLLKDRGFIAI
ncbi:MAG: bifunctional sulfate adenylyltransferase subunit 1/adenylylsulfate kinase [Lentisphaerae bacterium GWF2_52_8]|nr:MAG: bifunctional sulfate adenylyltransferase subunit 1/adenylylsulfate kinase [Lentisphaerae bacterium GWF2_52_8]